MAHEASKAPAVTSKKTKGLRRSMRLAVLAATVVLPTLLGGTYAFGIASDVYVSETQFWVRGNRPQQQSLLGGLLSSSGLASSAKEALAVKNYTLSHDAVRELDSRIGLREIYTRPEADWFSRMRENASLERMVRYHRSMVEAHHDDQSGITTLRVYAFRAEDARRVAEALLQISEELVNQFSVRAVEDALHVARNEVEVAERKAADARDAMDRFRGQVGELDPGQAGMSVRGIVSGLEAQLAQLRAEIGQKSSFMRPDNPQMQSLRTRAEAFEREIARERGRIAGEAGAIAGMIGGYERLMLQREFADRALTSSLTSLEQARLEAQRQQLYLVRVVHPQMPEEPMYPRRWLLFATVAAVAIVSYGVGVLGAAAVRDHIT